MTDQNQAHPNAGVLRRVLALVYDSLLAIALVFVYGAIATGIGNYRSGTDVPLEGEVIYDVTPAAQGLLFQLGLVAVLLAFFCYFWHRDGHTLGMRSWRLQLQTLSGENPSWGQCFLRFIAAIPSLLLGGLGYWWIWIDKDGRSWHDRASGTRVVQLPKEMKK